jgi:N-acetylglucosamine-6-phosphate deacetylase
VTAIAASRVVTPDAVVGPGVVDVEDGVIVDVARASGPVPERTLVPGFVDLQVNGADDVDVSSADDGGWERLGELLARGGTTTWCPTLVTAPLDAYAAPLERIAVAADRANRDRSGRPAIAGAHLEGPFLGGMPGAHPVERIVPLDGAWLDALPDVVRLVTLGAEVDGAPEAIASLAGRGIVVAIGHSSATVEEATAAIDAGARLVTHCFNAMPPLHHRSPGLVGAALSDSRVAVSLIADLAHVHPVVLTVALRAKGADRIALVTDSVAWRGDHVGGIGITYDGRAVRRRDGTLAGSALTMARAFANLVDHCGASLGDAARAAAGTPARVLGLTDRGRIAPGQRADLVALDGDHGVASTWIAGERVV